MQVAVSRHQAPSMGRLLLLLLSPACSTGPRACAPAGPTASLGIPWLTPSPPGQPCSDTLTPLPISPRAICHLTMLLCSLGLWLSCRLRPSWQGRRGWAQLTPASPEATPLPLVSALGLARVPWTEHVHHSWPLSNQCQHVTEPDREEELALAGGELLSRRAGQRKTGLPGQSAERLSKSPSAQTKNPWTPGWNAGARAFPLVGACWRCRFMSHASAQLGVAQGVLPLAVVKERKLASFLPGTLSPSPA